MVTTHPLYTTDEPELGYGQLFNVLSRRAVWLGGAVAGGLGVAFWLTLQEDPVYTSSMRLLVEPNYRQSFDITQEGDPNQRTDTQIDYATQLNLMRSQGFIEQTVEELLTTYPDLCGETQNIARCARQFKGGLVLSQIIEDDVETRIFEIEFSGEDPDFVQDFLETLSDVYLTYNVEQQELRLEQGLSLVNQQIDQMRTRLDGSRQQLKQFRESQNLISPQQQADTLGNTLSQLERTQIDVENEYQAAQAQVAALQQQLAADPQTALISSRLSQSSRYQQLLNALQATELALEERRAVYTDEDAGVQDLLSQRQGQVALLQEEVFRVLGEVPAQISLDEESLLTEGQLGGIDLSLASDLVQAQVELQSLTARRAGLAQSEQRLRAELNEMPSLIAEFDRIQPEIEAQQQSLEQLLQIRQELSNELAQGGF
ncbi:MAG: capsular biosynthesis protein, partial [Cyanobacteria bacterium P01_A01_bin.135]